MYGNLFQFFPPRGVTPYCKISELQYAREEKNESTSIYNTGLCLVGFVDSALGYGSLAELTEVPGTGIDFLQNSQKFRVRTFFVWKSYKTRRSSGRVCEYCTRTRTRTSGFPFFCGYLPYCEVMAEVRVRVRDTDVSGSWEAVLRFFLYQV